MLCFVDHVSYCPFSLLMYLSVPLPQSLVFYAMFCGPCVLLSFLFVDVVLSVPLSQSLVVYAMFCGPCVLLSFLFVDDVLSVPLPQSLVFYVMFCGPLSYCPFSLLMLYCLFLFLNLWFSMLCFVDHVSYCPLFC